MRTIVCSFLVVVLVSDTFGESPEPPISDTRLRVSTLVREDVFAGWMEDDMQRFSRAEKNLELLLKQRPKAKAETLAWKGGTKIYRAVLAHEAGKTEEFERYFQEAQDFFAEAKELGPKHPAVAAIVGGSYLEFGDRLPEKHFADAWSKSYDNYQILWKLQSRALDRLPRHIRGELLAGLAESAERTGRDKERDEFLDKIIEVLPGTQYERVAKQWKMDPKAAVGNRIACKYCHASGGLDATMARLDKK